MAEPLPTVSSAPQLQRPIFIAGPGRSGTTLLRSLLSAHSRIGVTPETHYMERAEKWGLGERDGPSDFDAFWERYVASVRFRDLNVDPERCRAMIEQADAVTFRSIFSAVLTAYGEQVGKARVGEKTPGHVEFIPQLLDWYPDARILILQRDPRAVVASQMRSPWVRDRLTPFSLTRGFVVGSRVHQVAYYAEDWANTYERIVPAYVDDPRVLVVRYERLVQDAEGELRRICAFLDEPFEPTMLSRRSDENVPLPASTAGLKDKQWKEWRKKHHEKTLRPISTKSLEKWKDQLTGRDVAMVEGHCARSMAEAGYELVSSAARRRRGRRWVRLLLVTEAVEAGIRFRIRRRSRRWRRRVERLKQTGR